MSIIYYFKQNKLTDNIFYIKYIVNASGVQLNVQSLVPMKKNNLFIVNCIRL